MCPEVTAANALAPMLPTNYGGDDMRHATPDQLKEVFGLFRTYPAIFPHMRQDALSRRIAAEQCIYEDGVAITYQQYKKRTRVGDVEVPRGAVMLHQIVNSQQFSGAGGRVFENFCAEVVGPLGGKLYLTVRQENKTACSFYKRHGMKVVGSVAWAKGTIPGHIYFRGLA
jgi:hypothetical protein